MSVPPPPSGSSQPPKEDASPPTAPWPATSLPSQLPALLQPVEDQRLPSFGGSTRTTASILPDALRANVAAVSQADVPSAGSAAAARPSLLAGASLLAEPEVELSRAVAGPPISIDSSPVAPRSFASQAVVQKFVLNSGCAESTSSVPVPPRPVDPRRRPTGLHQPGSRPSSPAPTTARSQTAASSVAAAPSSQMVAPTPSLGASRDVAPSATEAALDALSAASFAPMSPPRSPASAPSLLQPPAQSNVASSSAASAPKPPVKFRTIKVIKSVLKKPPPVTATVSTSSSAPAQASAPSFNASTAPTPSSASVSSSTHAFASSSAHAPSSQTSLASTFAPSSTSSAAASTSAPLSAPALSALPAKSKPPSTAPPEVKVKKEPISRPRSSSVLPVRAEIYNLPSDDDEDMIECEPDPEDVKPVIAPKVKTKADTVHRARQEEEEERERKRRRKEKRLEEERREEERKEERRKEKRRKEKAEEKERAKAKELKRAAIAVSAAGPSDKAFRPIDKDAVKPTSAGEVPSKSTTGLKSSFSSGEGPPSSQTAKPPPNLTTGAMLPPPVPRPQQSLFIKKPPPASLPPKKPTPQAPPLFSRATPAPSIDLTGEGSSPAPLSVASSSKRPAVNSVSDDSGRAPKQSTLESRSSSGKQTSQLSSSIFSFLESGEVEETVHDKAADRPRNEARERAKDKAFIVDGGAVSEDSGESEIDDQPIRPKLYGKSHTVRSSSPGEMEADDVPRAKASSSRAAGSPAPLPPSNMKTALPVKVKQENDMPAMDAKVVTQLFKGKVVSFKKGSDGFFNCTICRAYSKPHPVLFKIHATRCAADFEDYRTDTSDDETAESDTSFVSAHSVHVPTSRGKGKGRAIGDDETDSDDAGSGLGMSDGARVSKKVKKEKDSRDARQKKLEAKNATRKEKRETAKKRRMDKDDDAPRERKPKPPRDNRKIPSSARPSGGRGGPLKGKKLRLAFDDDEVQHIDTKPQLGGTRRQQPFARTAVATLDQEHFVVDSDDESESDDDDTIMVLVRGQVIAVAPVEGRYTCPACNSYKCKNPGWLKEHVTTKCKWAVIAPGTNPTAPEPVPNRARSPSRLPVPPSNVNTSKVAGVKRSASTMPSGPLPSFRRKKASLTSAVYTNDGTQAGPSRQVDTYQPTGRDLYHESLAHAFFADPQPQQSSFVDEYPDDSFDNGAHAGPSGGGGGSYLPYQRHFSAVNREPLPGSHYGYQPDHGMRRHSPSPPPRSPPNAHQPLPPTELELGPTDHPPPGLLCRALASLMYPLMPKPPPMALMQDIPLLLELLRKWQAVIICDTRTGFENGVTTAREGQVLRSAWANMMKASPLESRYSTWIDNVMRLWHCQYLLTNHLDRPSDFRDLVDCYFNISNRPALWNSGRTEHKHLLHLSTACKNLLRTVQDAWKHYKGPPALQVRWLKEANLSIAAPVHLELNHLSWEDLSAEMLGWADGVLWCYQELHEVERNARDAADKRNEELRWRAAQAAKRAERELVR